MEIYIDGKFFSKEEAKISVFDHGFLYGDGVFEGIRAYGGKVFRLQEHLDRLYASARAIMLQVSINEEEMALAVKETLKRSGLTDAYIRLVVTRGVGNLGLNPQACPKSSVIIIVDTLTLYPKEFYEKGMEVIVCSTRRNIPAALSPCIKSLNYLNNIMARLEVNQSGLAEGIMLNQEGNVAEATADNIFIVKQDGSLWTPPISAGALPGITRNYVMELASSELNLPVMEKVFTVYDLYVARECFLTGTGAEVVPVVRINEREIGKGIPGEITSRIMKLFSSNVKNSDAG